MRVMMVTRETGPDRRYGLGRSLMPVVEAMRARGIAVRYLCQDDITSGQLQYRENMIRRFSTWPGLRRRADWMAIVRAWIERLQVGVTAARLAREEHYTHVHAHDPWLALGVWFGLFGSGKRVRWGVTEHGFGSYSMATHQDGLTQGPWMQRLMRRIETTVLARADWVIAPTQACLVELARDLCVASPPRHWHAVPHARPAVEPGAPEKREQARALLGWRADEFVVLGVGRLVPLKCFDRVIEACAEVAKEFPSLRLVLLGGGDPAELKAVAASQGFAHRVEFAFVDDVTPYLHAADVYVSASSTESFGLANLEALCAGLPSICSPVGGVAEVVGDGAWLVPGESAALANSIAALARDASLRQDWARRALARSGSWPAASEITKRYVEIYQAPPA
ncbi:MAG: glycosyltransferase family 4 protein [Pseudomonadota bacterium]